MTASAPPLGARLTLFATCRAFKGEIGVMQTNALQTWAQLGVPILVLGDDPGAEEAAASVGARFIAEVPRTARGTPEMGGLFQLACEQTATPYLAYVNADILLRPTFTAVVEAALKHHEAAAGADAPVLLTMRRRNLPASAPLSFDDGRYVTEIDALDHEYGSWDSGMAVDVFVFNRDLFDDIPDLAIGRTQWDNWLVWKARERGAAIIDASPDCPVHHPIHGYTDGWRAVRQGAEAAENRRIAQGRSLSLDDAVTHLFEDGRLVALDDAARADLRERFAPDPERQLAAGLDHLVAGLDRRPLAETLDACRVLLAPMGRFFPLHDAGAIDPARVRAALETARSAAGAGDTVSAARALQDLLSAPFAEIVRARAAEGRTVFVWGAGQAGAQLLAYLERLGLAASGLVDSNPALCGAERFGVPVVADGWNALRKVSASPFVVVASMYAAEIAESLTRAGARPFDDFVA